MRRLDARIASLESRSPPQPDHRQWLRELVAVLDEAEALAARGAPARPLTPARERMERELAALGALTDDPAAARQWLARAHAELARLDEAHRP